MNGEIAALYQNNKQVGGVYSWEINLANDSTTVNGWQESTFKKNISANSYWLVETPVDDCFEVKFYKVMQGSLVLMDEGIVDILLPDTITLDRRLDAPLEIIWRKSLEY